MPETLILTRTDIAALLTATDYIDAVADGFRHLAAGHASIAAVTHVESEMGIAHIKSASIGQPVGHMAVKVNANFPQNPGLHGLPTIQGIILLCDGRTGSPLAILDSGEVTAQRTAATSALAARHLAQPGARVAAVIGCGVQGRAHLTALCAVFALERAYVHDVDPAAARAFANEMSERTGVRVAPVSAVSEATRRSPIIVTCTTSRRGFLGPSDVTPGAFIAAVGADNPDKQELLPTLMAESAVFVDQLEQCAAIGELHHALDAGALTRAQVRADLGQVVTGGHPGRLSDEEIVVFDSTGTAIQDVAASVAIYARARERGLGTRITLG